jgi:anti-anti-sigma regulatory factor
MHHPNEMRVHEHGPVVVVDIVDEQCGQLAKLLEPQLEAGRRAFVFDLAQAGFLNSVNIASLISARNRIVALGGRVAVANLTDNIKSVFRILKLERLFELDLQLDAALAKVR